MAERRFRKNTLKQIRSYSIKYGYILTTGDAAALTTLSPSNRLHAMSALAALAKSTGRYNQWQQIRQRYNLKWSSGDNSLQAMQRFFNPNLTLESMLQRVRNMIEHLQGMGKHIVKLAVLTGLRCSEAVESVRLLVQTLHNYYNPQQQCLEHFRFPDIFLRQTKKAYISYITKEMLSGIGALGSPEARNIPSHNAIRLAVRRKGLSMDMHLCLKINGSWLHSHGVSALEVDFLHGRVNPSVFAQHYLTPDSTLRQRVLVAVSQLEKEIK